MTIILRESHNGVVLYHPKKNEIEWIRYDWSLPNTPENARDFFCHYYCDVDRFLKFIDEMISKQHNQHAYTIDHLLALYHGVTYENSNV